MSADVFERVGYPQTFFGRDGESLTLYSDGSVLAAYGSGLNKWTWPINSRHGSLVAFAKAVLAQQAGREREVLVEAVNRARYEQQIAGEGFDAAALAYVEARKALLDFDDKAAG